MELPSLKELNKIIRLCRKQGIKVFELGDLRITLTDTIPATPSKSKDTAVKASQQANTVPDSLPTTEELLFWSAGGEDNLQ